MKKHIFVWGMLSVFLVSTIAPAAQAQTSQSLTELIAQLTAQVQTLQTQLEALKAAQVQVQQTQADVAGTLQLIGGLREGMSGDDVRLLQTALAADSTVYPEGLITGYFGRLTVLAVRRFQSRHGLSQVGFVGPATLAKLNELLRQNIIVALANASNHDSNDTDEDANNKWENRHCVIVPPGHLIAPGWLRKRGKGDDRFIVPVCQTIPPGIMKKFPWWFGTSTHPFPTSTPPAGGDVTPPVISSIAATNVTASGAMIVWTTNESARSKVYYSATSSFALTSASSVSDNSFVKNHILALGGLNAGTTYYYVVESRDIFGNTATSTYQSFTTGASADVTAPVLSALAVSGITTSSASVTWTTNESATTKVYYGTSTPVNIATAQTYLNAALTTAHAAPLASLLSGTTYYFIVTSADGSGNTATSTESSFTTVAADVTAPLISAVLSFGITSSTATVSWTTNESGTSKVYFATSTPVNLATAASVSDATLATGHSLDLSGLSASSTYYYVVESQDAASNTATSTEFSFGTL